MEAFRYIIAVTCLGYLAWLLIRHVVPRIRDEAEFNAPSAAWIDLWLPLITAVPFGLATALTYPPPGEWWYSIWYAAAPPAIVASFLLGIVLMLVRGDRIRGGFGFELRHGLALVLVGAILALASLADRLSILHGQMMLVAAVVWMWLCSPTHDEENSKRPSVRGRLILDWSGKLKNPVTWTAKIMIGLVIVIWGGLSFVFFRFDLPLAACTAAILQFFIGTAVVWSLGRGPAQRFIVSTLVFAVLIGIGGMASSKLYTNVYIPFFPESYDRFGPEVLIGVSSVRATGIQLIGLGVIVFLLGMPLPTASNSDMGNGRNATDTEANQVYPRYPLTAVLLILAALVVAITGSEPALRDAGMWVARMIWHGLGGPWSTP